MEGTYNAYLWVCVGLWSTERIVRIARILFFSWKSLVKHNGLVSLGDVGDGDQLIHLVVQTLISYHPKPGQYYFLYFPTSWSPWENHPFTLAGVTTNVETGCTELHFLAKVHRGATQRLARRARKAGGDMQLKVWLEGPYGHTAPLDKFENVMMASCYKEEERETTGQRLTHPSVLNRLLAVAE
jgi:predicted ferric reductase